MTDWRKYRDKDGNYLTKQQYQQLYGKGQEVPKTEDKVFDAVSNTGESLDLFTDDSLEVLANLIFAEIDGVQGTKNKRKASKFSITNVYSEIENYEMGELKPVDEQDINVINFIEKMKKQPWYKDYINLGEDMQIKLENYEINSTDAKNIEHAWLMDKLMDGIKASGQNIEDWRFRPTIVAQNSPADSYVEKFYPVADGANVTINDLMKITKRDVFAKTTKYEPVEPNAVADSLLSELVNKYDLDPKLLEKAPGLEWMKGADPSDPNDPIIEENYRRQQLLKKQRRENKKRYNQY